MQPEALAQGVDDRVSAHRREAPRHLDERREAQRAEKNGPEQLVAKLSTGLGGRHHRADLEKASDAREYAERDLEELLRLHRVPGAGSDTRSCASTSASFSSCARSAAPSRRATASRRESASARSSTQRRRRPSYCFPFSVCASLSRASPDTSSTFPT